MRLFALTCFAAAVLASGCAHTRQELDLGRRAGTYVYDQPIEEIWPKVRPVFEEHGFRVREDPKTFSMDTEWKTDFASSQVAAVHTRYLVLGDPLGPTRAKLRVFRIQRSASKALERPGDDILWGVSPVTGTGRGGSPSTPGQTSVHDDLMQGEGASSSPRASIFEQSEWLDRPDGTTRAAAFSGMATRDLDMEWQLLKRIDPDVAAQIEAGKTVIARTVRPQELVTVPAQHAASASSSSGAATTAAADASATSSAQTTTGDAAISPSGSNASGAPLQPASGALECGSIIPGLDRIASPGAVVLLGEIHGTREVPQFLGNAACQLALQKTPVTVGLELPASESELVQRYLLGNGTPEEFAALIDGPFWLRAYQDGRSSLAMAQLIERIRQLRTRGLDVLVFFFDDSRLQGEPREDAMARRIEKEVANHPERFFLVLSGNIHNRKASGTDWNPNYTPMGLRLSRRLPKVTSLDLAYASGSAWICTVDSRLDCGERPAKGVDNGVRPFIHLWSSTTEHGFDGIFYVGAVTASAPARGVQPTSSSSRPEPSVDP